MPISLNFKFPEGKYILNCDNTELKSSSIIIFFFFRTASLGGGVLKDKHFYSNICERIT